MSYVKMSNNMEGLLFDDQLNSEHACHVIRPKYALGRTDEWIKEAKPTHNADRFRSWGYQKDGNATQIRELKAAST